MLNAKLAEARKIAKALRPSEDTIDTSIAENARLLIAIVEARLASGVAAEVGHEALLSASAGIASLTQARDHVITCHKQLASTRDDQGLTPRGVGCTIGKPTKDGSVFSGATNDQAVAA